ncbi:signal peptidase I [Streptomyces armeniacus]|uniref:Signal peptidase I n=1 Tax=Streptomyces armeniacus TaxID=83291 RepID=A0A345XNL6_9ACTN|nr:signal peptidase I [Streptomyces armeniacus]AXK33232.1 signal peptidase I [Streptomyces armeniacus]
MGKAGRTGGRPGSGRGHALSGLAVALGCVLFLGGFVWGAIAYQPYTVPTDSMNPTVKAGDRVLAERIDGGEVRRGDVVVFEDTVWGDLPMVKRVIGVGGDKVACCDKAGQLTVNGRPVEEPYLSGSGPASSTGFDETVPEGRLFLLGDYRQGSQDSRVRLQGDHWAVPRSAVSARVDATAWPMGSVGTVERPDAFAGLPGGVSDPGPLRLLLAAIVAGALLILGGAAHGPIVRRRARAARSRQG